MQYRKEDLNMSNSKSFSRKIAVLAVFPLIIILSAIIANKIFISAPDLSPNTLYVSGTLAERSLDDLYEQSALIALGTVTGKSDAFQIKSVSENVANFTDYYFNINSALRGVAESDTITVRVQGGTVGNYTEIYEFSPKLELNHEYLLFLYKPGRGGAYNTEGDYYYVLGLAQGSFTEDKDGNFVSEMGTVLTHEMLISTLSENEDNPVNENYFRDEYILNQQKNLQNGFITEDEYNEMMANIDQYATIIK